ncbi:ABC transporter permease [Asticcacaulis sp. 201]|uniref:ABC transporter permease n=1 Tax=Asticcacaulis sp. 201 TaxID=3028787 RepID=UPI0029163966|nr:ABC transporter permease [Asticcacaulis sp. 201]MDV6332271.1 ABC transporter permease [Asticcacaulis sp. 201]
MLKSTFTAFYRSFVRHPLYALLNLLGLSLGIAVFIALSLFYRFETSYESWSPKLPQIYTIGISFHFPGMTDDTGIGSMGGLLEELKTAYPQTDGTRYWPDSVIVHKGADVFNEQINLVDANFLIFFAVPVVYGDPANALSDPSHVVLSASLARKYFGVTNAVGRTMVLNDEEGLKTYTVSAIVADLPKNTEMKLDILRLLTPQRTALRSNWHHWGSVQLATYLKFKSRTEANALAVQFPAFTDRQAGQSFGPDVKPHKMLELKLIPLADAHLISPKLKAAVISLGVVGIVALALALINYVNLATARAGLRAREVAVRKTLGAAPLALRLQFIFEAMLTLLLAFLVALSFVELSLPLLNSAGGLSLKLDYHADALWIASVLAIVMVAGLVAALYPAFALSAFKPAQVLASSRTPGGGRTAGILRTGLAMVQFTAVAVAFILIMGFLLQIRHIQNADIGFQRSNLMIVNSIRDNAVTQSQRDAFVAGANALPGVSYVTIANAIPGDTSSVNNSNIVRPGQVDSATESPTVNYSIVGPEYFQLLGAKMLVGRVFDVQRGEDQMWDDKTTDKDRVYSVVISRRAARDMGFPTPQAALNQTARFNDHTVRIIGVVEDMRFYNPNEPIPAKLYLFDAHASESVVGMVRYQGLSAPAMREKLQHLWRQIAPAVPFDVTSAADNLDKYYKPERDRTHLFTIGAGIAALIGCIGLYGMAAFNTGRRVREIGVRKVLGASAGRVVGLLLRQFLYPVAIASLIAWPLGWLALERWLSQFDDAIAMPLWVFPVASGVALAIALVTVAGVAFGAASTEPGKALRHE